MDFSFTEEQQMLKTNVRTFLDKEIVPVVDEYEQKGPLTKGTIAMIRGPHKLVRYAGYKGNEIDYELYDLENDPEELVDLYSANHTLAASLRSELEEKLQGVNQPYLWQEHRR